MSLIITKCNKSGHFMPRLPFPPCTTFFFFLSSISIGKIGILGDLLTSCLFLYLLYQLAGNQIIFHLLFCKCIIYFQGRETQSFIVATPPKNCLYDYVVYNSIQYPGAGRGSTDFNLGEEGITEFSKLSCHLLPLHVSTEKNWTKFVNFSRNSI